MASTLIGHTACPECGFKTAEVKRSEKTLYRHCRDGCGSQYIAKQKHLEKLLLDKTRLVDAIPSAAPATATATPAPAPKVEAVAPVAQRKAPAQKAPAAPAPAVVPEAPKRNRLLNWGA